MRVSDQLLSAPTFKEMKGILGVRRVTLFHFSSFLRFQTVCMSAADAASAPILLLGHPTETLLMCRRCGREMSGWRAAAEGRGYL